MQKLRYVCLHPPNSPTAVEFSSAFPFFWSSSSGAGYCPIPERNHTGILPNIPGQIKETRLSFWILPGVWEAKKDELPFRLLLCDACGPLYQGPAPWQQAGEGQQNPRIRGSNINHNLRIVKVARIVIVMKSPNNYHDQTTEIVVIIVWEPASP